VNDDAIFKILYLAIRTASQKWTMPLKQWGMAINQFAMLFGNERGPLS
jgi:transposase-like protein